MISDFIYNLRKINYNVVIVLILSVIFGLVNICGIYHGGSIFSKQAMWAVTGILVFFAFAFLDYRIFNNSVFLVILYSLAVLMLISVFVIGTRINGSKSWFVFGPLAFEPVEAVKIILLMVFAKYFSKRHKEMFDFKNILISGIYTIIPTALVMIQPDLGSALILMALWFGIVLFVGIKPLHFFIVIMTFIVFGFLGWHFLLHPYQKQRILIFLHPQEDPLGAGYNIQQSLVTIGSGGMFGTGVGRGSEITLGFLPAAYSDFAFASLIEQWGFVGGMVFFLLFGYLIWQIIIIAIKSDNNFARIFVSGSAILLSTQALINIGMNIGILPITGIPLPLFSAGGSNLVSTFALLGIVESIAIRS